METAIVVNSFEELTQAAKKVKGCADSYSETVRKMNRWVDQLSEAWEGKDQTAYVSRMKEFTEKLDVMAKKICKASEVLEQEKRNYMHHVDHNIHEINNLPH